MADSAHDENCPLIAVDRRLEDVHKHWHDAEQAYFDPEGFRIAIQAAIQTLRTVSFILQSNKRIFVDFETWYATWQATMRADPLMRWMIDARNKIEKQGDLEMHSVVRAEIIASHYDMGPCLDLKTSLFDKPEELIKRIPPSAKAHVLKDGIFRIQRRWVENTLPDYELLDAVAIAYGKIADLVGDAHAVIGIPITAVVVGDQGYFEGVKVRGGRLPCMIGHGDERTLDIWLATGEVIEYERETVKYDRKKDAGVLERYGLTSTEIFRSRDNVAESTLNDIFATGRKMFSVDGHHLTIAFLLRGNRPINIVEMRLREHGEKYVLMRRLANDVLRTGADGVILISEIWSAEYDPKKPYQRAQDALEKKEYLSAVLVSKTGVPVQLTALIMRSGDQVSLGETQTTRDDAQIAFAPIYSAWGREIPESWTKFENDGGSTSKL